MYLVIERMGKIKQGVSVLHFAPEQGIAGRLSKFSSRYVKADLHIEQYANIFKDAVRVDLCSNDLQKYEGQFDLILHNHVLEHLPCNIAEVLRRMQKCLRPGGSMFFTTPIRKNAETTECLDGSLTEQERARLFGQGDHVRMLGEKDVQIIFAEALGTAISIAPTDVYLSADDYSRYRIPSPSGLSGETLFMVTA